MLMLFSFHLTFWAMHAQFFQMFWSFKNASSNVALVIFGIVNKCIFIFFLNFKCRHLTLQV